VPWVLQVLSRGRPRAFRALFDAGAGKSDAGVRALWDLAEQNRNLDITLRACRYPHRLPASEPDQFRVAMASNVGCADSGGVALRRFRLGASQV